MYSVISVSPLSGSFVRIWTYKGIIYSDDFQWQGNRLMVYSREADELVVAEGTAMYESGSVTNIRYIVQGEDE